MNLLSFDIYSPKLNCKYFLSVNITMVASMLNDIVDAEISVLALYTIYFHRMFVAAIKIDAFYQFICCRWAGLCRHWWCWFRLLLLLLARMLMVKKNVYENHFSSEQHRNKPN